MHDQPLDGGRSEDTFDPPPGRQWPVVGSLLLLGVILGAFADIQWNWFEATFRLFCRLFYEQWALAELRLPSQIALARWHLGIGLVLLGLILIVQPRVTRHVWMAFLCFAAGYAIRASCWVLGGNLPLVPGDSCHYIEVATSVYRGEGPVKHYVESFFRDYRPQGILEGKGVLDDWATPLWAYILAGAYRLTGVVPGVSLDATFAIAKGLSFFLNLACLPLIYFFARRNWSKSVALGALAVLAILPVHAIYAGFELRESLVAFTALSALFGLMELLRGGVRTAWAWAVPVGILAGSAMLARDTLLIFLGASFLYSLLVWRRTHLGPLLLAGTTALVVLLPWAWVTYSVYGSPFYSYTQFFAYNFSWTVHHFDRGNTRPGQFFTVANMPEIIRVKIRAFAIVSLYSCMILGLPMAAGFVGCLKHTLFRLNAPDGKVNGMIAFTLLAFVLATLARIADVTQVEQLGRYYLPLYMVMIPVSLQGLYGLCQGFQLRSGRFWVLAAFFALLWSDPSWAYDSVWFRRPYQLHWPALVEAGRWIQDNPEKVPAGSRILTWFPWELRVTSNRTTILFPRALEAGEFERRRVQETLANYKVTHVLWGSFETVQDANPEALGLYLTTLREGLGLVDTLELYRSKKRAAYPVRLYAVRGR